jgi:plasmid stabilization system protein ParE
VQGYHIIIKPGAEADIDEIFDWYELQKMNLGFEFLDAVEQTIQSIKRNPQYCFNVTNEVRRANLHRFPYSIFFSIENDKVFVHAVMHLFRSPTVWQERFRF